jgi:hypothetical protein
MKSDLLLSPKYFSDGIDFLNPLDSMVRICGYCLCIFININAIVIVIVIVVAIVGVVSTFTSTSGNAVITTISSSII